MSDEQLAPNARRTIPPHDWSGSEYFALNARMPRACFAVFEGASDLQRFVGCCLELQSCRRRQRYCTLNAVVWSEVRRRPRARQTLVASRTAYHQLLRKPCDVPTAYETHAKRKCHWAWMRLSVWCGLFWRTTGRRCCSALIWTR